MEGVLEQAAAVGAGGGQSVDHIGVAAQSLCRHRHAEDRSLCNAVIDPRGHHAATCEVGGGVVARHNGARDWLAYWIAAQSGQTVSIEQYVPRWDRVDDDGSVMRARLDVVFSEAADRRLQPFRMTGKNPLCILGGYLVREKLKGKGESDSTPSF